MSEQIEIDNHFWDKHHVFGWSRAVKNSGFRKCPKSEAALCDCIEQLDAENKALREAITEELGAIIKALDFESDNSVPHMGRMRKATAIATAALSKQEKNPLCLGRLSNVVPRCTLEDMGIGPLKQEEKDE